MMPTRKQGQRLTPEERAKIAADVKRTHNAAQAAAKNGVSSKTAWKIAQSENASLKKSCGEIAELLREISGGMTNEQLGVILNIPSNGIKCFSVNPELPSAKWIRENILDKLLAAFPGKAQEIKALEILTCQPRISVDGINRHVKEQQQDFREAAGMLLREMREGCGLSAEEVQASLNRHPTVQRNLPRIEAGDGKLPSSVCREAIPAIYEICNRAAPQQAAPYLPLLETISAQLKR